MDMNVPRRDGKSPDEVCYFMGHYVPWRRTRLKAIVRHFGRGWFRDKRILELGCGYGHMGISLAYLGANVTFSDARQKHLDNLAEFWPTVPDEQLICANLEREWPFKGHWDLILHQGLLYHLTNWQFGLEKAVKCCDHMALECETLDAANPSATKIQLENEERMHSSIDGKSERVPAARIETELAKVGFKFKLCLDERLNTTRHNYTWKPRNNKLSTAMQRRWWWCWTGGNDGPS